MAESSNDKKFMREKIVKPPLDKRKLAERALRLVLCAVIFGIVAAAAFVCSAPLMKRLFAKETEKESIPITIEKDTEPGNENAEMETMEETTADVVLQEDLENEVEDIVNRALKKFAWTPEQVSGYYKALQTVAQEADKGLVTVSSVRHQVDWFDNPVESAGQYAGVIVTVNPREVIILTGETAVEGADALEIIFGDDSRAVGTVKQRDTVAQMAVVSVMTSELSESTMNWIKAVELGNSYTVRAGEPVIAVGSPAGRVHSVAHGMISYAASGVQVPDGQTRVFYTTVDCNVEKGTFFLNLSGQLIGWATSRFTNEDNSDVTMAMSVSEYKGILQKLSNGVQVPYLGIYGQDVTAQMKEQGILQGVYITESIAGSPAYEAGIQPGDILTKMGDTELLSVRDYQRRLEERRSGETVTLTIQRKGIDEYKEIQYDVIIGAR